MIVWSLINKDNAETFENFFFFEKVKRSRQLIPVILLILGMLSGSYFGDSFIRGRWCINIILFSKSLSLETFKKSLLGATKTSCAVAFILAGSSFLSLAMGFTGLQET